MRPRKVLSPSLALFGFAAILCYSPSCRAQEPNPDHFTDSGVETYPERQQQPAAPRKAVQTAQAKQQAKQLDLTPASAKTRKSTRASSKGSASSSGK